MPQRRVCTFALFCLASSLVGASSGCVRSLSQLDQHAQAFSSAAVLVTNSSEDAYTSANRLHSNEQIALAVIDYDKSTAWNPEHYVKPLLSDDQLLARREVLEGLKSYAESLSALTAPRGSTGPGTGLRDAARGVGSNLQQLSANINTTFGTGTGSSISDTEKNVLSTALVALGTYLQQRTVRKQLPAVIQSNDKTIGDICDALVKDIEVLKRQASKDYGELQVAQDSYIRHANPPFTAEQRRAEIAKLPALVRKQQQNDFLLSKLEETLTSLKGSHHALAAAAQGSDTVSVQEAIAQLLAEGESLATYYESLSSS